MPLVCRAQSAQKYVWKAQQQCLLPELTTRVLKTINSPYCEHLHVRRIFFLFTKLQNLSRCRRKCTSTHGREARAGCENVFIDYIRPQNEAPHYLPSTAFTSQHRYCVFICSLKWSPVCCTSNIANASWKTLVLRMRARQTLPCQH